MFSFNDVLHIEKPESLDIDNHPKTIAFAVEPDSVVMDHTAARHHLIVTQNSSLSRVYSHKYRGLWEYTRNSWVNFIPYPRNFCNIEDSEQGIIIADETFKCTSIERTLVDLMQLPEFSGGIDEILEAYDCGLNNDFNWGSFLKYMDIWNTPTLNIRIKALLTFYKERWEIPFDILSKIDVQDLDSLRIELFWGESTLFDKELGMWAVDLKQFLPLY